MLLAKEDTRMKRTLSDRVASLAVGAGLLMAATSWATGNVTAVVTDGDLVIHGDAADNAFAVQLGEVSDTIEVAGFDGTTTVNGGARFTAVGLTGDIRIALRCGDGQLNVI